MDIRRIRPAQTGLGRPALAILLSAVTISPATAQLGQNRDLLTVVPLDRIESALTPAAKTSVDARSQRLKPADDSAIDFITPPLRLVAAWTARTTSDRRIDEMTFTVENQGDISRTYKVTLLWDDGTSNVRTKTLGDLTLAPQEKRGVRLARGSIPAQASSGKYPGMLRLTVASTDGEDTIALPAFYAATPAMRDVASVKRWDRELLSGSDLRAFLHASDPATDSEPAERVIEWQPSGKTANVDGGAS